MLSILKTKFGKEVIVIDGFSFSKDKAALDGKIYWKCIEFQRKLCRKRVYTKMVKIVEALVFITMH